MPLPWSLPVVRLVSARSVEIDESWRWSLHDALWRVYRNRNDGAWIHWRGQRLDLSAGSVWLLPPWLTAESGCRGRVHHDYLHLDVTGLDQGLLRRHACAPRRLDDPEGRWAALLDSLPWPHPPAPTQQLHTIALVATAVAGALAGATPDDAAGDAPSLAAIQPAIVLVEHHPEAPIDVAAMAARCGLDRHTFARRFRAALGVAPAHWLAERRIARAAALLAGDDASIDAVAAACGFANRYHFSRVFARILGCGPAAYRNGCRGGLAPNSGRNLRRPGRARAQPDSDS